MEELSQVSIKQTFINRSYKSYGVEGCRVYISGKKRGMTRTLKKHLKRISAIEPHIGHMKLDGKLRRNYLKGTLGDVVNALLCAIGHNMRLIWQKLRSFLAFIWVYRLGSHQHKYHLKQLSFVPYSHSSGSTK